VNVLATAARRRDAGDPGNGYGGAKLAEISVNVGVRATMTGKTAGKRTRIQSGSTAPARHFIPVLKE
jgi:hypothetical protein